MADASNKPVWRHLLWVVPLLILGWAGDMFLTAYQDDQLVAQEGQKVQGLIVGKSTASKGKSGGMSYRFDYRFTTQTGQTVTGVARVGQDQWERTQERDPIAVVYAPSNPTIHRAEGEEPAFSLGGAIASLLLIVVLFGAGLYGCFWGRW